MKIIITIEETKLELKKAIAKGWNERFEEDLTYKDIRLINNKDDIIGAIPYIADNKIKVDIKAD